MSLLRAPLNLWLRTVEKPALRRGTPETVRPRFEWIARLCFHGPRDVTATWQDIAGRPALGVTPPGAGPSPVLLYIHGGAFVFGSPRTHRALMARLAKLTGLRAVLPSYRLAPEHPFPAALDDVRAVYAALAQDGPVILGGDSAGGALALSLLAEIPGCGLPAPMGLFAFSPLTDLTFSGESLTRNARAEAVLPAERAQDMVAFYLNGHQADDPRASPLFAAFHGAPPVWISVGTTEILLDDTTRMAARLRAQGVAVTERIEDDLPHVWPIFHDSLPEARQTLKDLARWITSLSPPSNGS